MIRTTSGGVARAAVMALLATSALAGVLSAQPAPSAPRRVEASEAGAAYPTDPGPARLRGVHAMSGHADLTCRRCHRTSARGARMRTPTATCDDCHAQLARSLPAMPARTRPASPRRVRFSHARHATGPAEPDGGCAGCHSEGQAGSRALPTMATCMACHARRGASQRCDSCHVTTPGGRLRTRFRDGTRLLPRGPLLGMAHDRDWLVRHRWVGADHGDVCASCHTERDCEACHDGRRPPSRIHPGDFLSLHAQQARRKATRCESCHAVQRFCSECHARLGIGLGAAPAVATRSRVHPPAAIWLGGVNRHAIDARRDLAGCASCHAEADCVVCHGAGGIGAGHNPHGPGIVAECEQLWRRNARACVRCHGARTRLCW